MHFIIETDPEDLSPARVHGPFDTDEDAVTWAGQMLARGTWHYATQGYTHDGIYEGKEPVVMQSSGTWCQMVHDGYDTDGTKWNRCTVHDHLVLDGAYLCERYRSPGYTGTA